ncbi:hypothetical protein HY734_00950 [Candidatus Uhrbacteria bacterium]|nr:hypothetical protein [Candidatus Uhrbacteria bacterium]
MVFSAAPVRKRRNHARRVHLSRYRARSFQNPYFSNRLPSHWRTLSLTAAGIGLGVMVALTSFLLTSPRFLLTSVRIEGTQTIRPQAIRSVVEEYLNKDRWLFFKARHRLLFQTTALDAELRKQFVFEQVEIALKPPEVVVSVAEKTAVSLWSSGEHTYLLDARGIALREVSLDERTELLSPPPLYGPFRAGQDTSAGTLPLVACEDTSAQPVAIGDELLPEVRLASIRQFVERLKTLGISVERCATDPRIGTWMTAFTEAGYAVLFDPALPIDSQADNLAVVLRERVPDPSRLQYVDVRFGDYVYYK